MSNLVEAIITGVGLSALAVLLATVVSLVLAWSMGLLRIGED